MTRGYIRIRKKAGEKPQEILFFMFGLPTGDSNA
tara:strand:+ start:12795 stop:12896 length:102 start_codon:yes stop_codon:yes gene_type:complete